MTAGQAAAPELPNAEEYGPTPTIVAPHKARIPTLRIATARPWRDGKMPQPATGLRVLALAGHLQHPRWLYVLPNGDVLVAESEAPAKPADGKGIRGKVQKMIMKWAGSGAQPSANRVTLLRQPPVDGSPVERHTFLQALNSPIGMALVGNWLYVANTDALVRFPYHSGEIEITAPPAPVVALPAGTINHHWTKSLVASPDGQKLYVGVGSNSNAGENGLDAEKDRAAVWEIDVATGEHRIYASGLRNPVGLAWQGDTDILWVSVNERDELGDHVPPDYMTALHAGAFYGFPFSYYGQHLDERAHPPAPQLVSTAILPDYALGAHTASLGLCWSGAAKLPAPFRNGLFVGQHGSWNRKVRSGYKVIFVRFENGKPTGLPIEVLGGFLSPQGHAQGRPVGLAVDSHGALLVADDVGNTVWRVTALESDGQ